MWADKRIFADPALQAEVWERGYAARRLMSEEEAAAALQTVAGICDAHGVDFSPTENGHGDYHTTGAHPSKAYRAAIQQFGREVLADRALAFFEGYRFCSAALFVKPPGLGQLQAHSDNALLIDHRWPFITVWCALTEATMANGALEFVPGSHSLFDFPITNNGGRPYSSALPLLERLTVPNPLSPGEVLLFDTSIIHKSNANRTAVPRVTMLLGFAPEGVRPAVFQVSETNPAETLVMAMDGEERIEHSITDVRLGRVATEIIDRVPTPGIKLTSDEMMAVLVHGDMLRNRETTVAEIQEALAAGLPLPRTRKSADRRIFHAAGHEASFARSGFFKEQLLSPATAAQLLEEVLNLTPDDRYDPGDRFGEAVTYHMTELDTNTAYKQKVRELATRYFAKPIERLLADYRVLTTTLFVKPPGKGMIPMHTDWTVQEDLSWPTVYIWCPLEDVEEANGPLRILEGSHGVIDFLHGPCMTAPYRVDDDSLLDQMTSIPVAAGEAIIFDAGALHWSPDNTTDRPRFAVRLACIPKHRRGVLYRQSPDDADVLEMFSMETEEFESHNGLELVGGTLKTRLLRKVANPHLRLTGEEIRELIAQGDRIRAGETSMDLVLGDLRARKAAAAAAQAGPAPASANLAARVYRRLRREAGRVKRRLMPAQAAAIRNEPDFAPYPAPPAPWEPFGDQRINAALAEEGYATMAFLTPDEVDTLGNIIDTAEDRLDRDDVHIPTHFMLSAFNNDGAYKERLFDGVWAYLEPKVSAVLPGYEPLVINVFDKPPSDAYDPVPIHQNPSFVDEPAHKSVSLWIPLCDVDRSNGTVGVLPGSHNRFNTMRAGNMAHEEIFADVRDQLENELFVPVEMTKGEMLALDDSILHWSYPNVSATRRKAVQLIMVPRGVPHIYYYYDDQDPAAPMMDRYKVDRHFFFGFNCKALLETLEHIDRVPYRYRRIAEAELLATGNAQ